MSTILNRYIDKDNKTISIGKEDWKSLNEQYDKDVIKGWIIEEIMEGNIKFPYNEITLDDAKDSFLKLCEYEPHEFKTDHVMTRFDYERYHLNDKYIDDTLVGNNASNYFQQVPRSFAGSKLSSMPSPREVWASEHQLGCVLKSLWSLKMTELTMNTLKTAIAMRKYWASQFRPAMAKSIYEKFNAVDVLDFSSGWGDRLCGFYACKNTKSYIGIDPNKEVYDNYFKQADFYKTLTDEKKVEFLNLPAEDVEIKENIVDMVFTSPPYFCAETYTSDDTQSWIRYKDISSWLNGFMFKTLDMAWKALKPNGNLVINISDIYRRGNILKICDPMNDYIKNVLHGEEGEHFGMKLGRRPNCLSYKGKDGVCVEPVWVWKKPSIEMVLPDEHQEIDKSKKIAVIDEMEVKPEYEKPKVTPPTEIEWVVDEMNDIDPRTFAKLIAELKSKLPIPLVIIHGDDGCDDIILKLCKALDISTRKLYNGGVLVESHIGKKKLVKCQPNSKPEFVKLN